ncbi:MAG TPA: hypothetical protein VNK96_03010 [Fimbriimonadales bacterium]|nr:hypothetical protein [Fimbriimonadales bacterium]
MKPLAWIVAGVLIGIGFGVSLGSILATILLGVVGFVFGALIGFARSQTLEASSSSIEVLDTNSRMRLRPIEKLHDEILRSLRENSSNPILSALEFDVRTDVEEIFNRSIEILRARRALLKMMAGLPSARNAIKQLEEKMRMSNNEEERKVIENSLKHRQEELQNYEKMEEERKRLEAELDEVESALAELRSRILLTSAPTRKEGLSTFEQQELSETIQRLQRVSSVMQQSLESLSLENW